MTDDERRGFDGMSRGERIAAHLGFVLLLAAGAVLIAWAYAIPVVP